LGKLQNIILFDRALKEADEQGLVVPSMPSQLLVDQHMPSQFMDISRCTFVLELTRVDEEWSYQSCWLSASPEGLISYHSFVDELSVLKRGNLPYLEKGWIVF
jgi:hypothetical protein